MKIVSPFIMLSFSLCRTNSQTEHNITAVPALAQQAAIGCQLVNTLELQHFGRVLTV